MSFTQQTGSKSLRSLPELQCRAIRDVGNKPLFGYLNDGVARRNGGVHGVAAIECVQTPGNGALIKQRTNGVMNQYFMVVTNDRGDSGSGTLPSRRTTDHDLGYFLVSDLVNALFGM